MRALVTGGSGFIGSHVVDKLLEKGVDVRIFDAVMPNSNHRNDVEYCQNSILDLDALGFAMHGVGAVFHLAAVADVKTVYEEPCYSESINTKGTLNVLEAARKAKVERIIYGSTTWVYSEAEEDSVDETTPLHAPSHLYTASKLAGEYYCQSYSKLYGLKATILRFGIPYGPRARDGAVIPIFVKKALNKDPITIAGDGSQFRKFIYVEDLAEGIVLALQSKAINMIYNLDGREPITIRQIAETIKKILGDVQIEHTAPRPGDFSGKDISSSKAKKELGWEAKVTFEEGIRRYLKWYQKREEKNKADWEKLDDILKK